VTSPPAIAAVRRAWLPARWWVAGGLVAASVLLGLAASASQLAQAVASGLVFTAVAGGAAARIALRNGRRDLFAPAVMVLGYFAFGIGVKGLTDLFGQDSKIGGVLDPTSPDFARVLTSVFLHSLLGTVAFLAGDWIARRGRTQGESACPAPLLSEEGTRLSLALGLLLTALGAAVLIAVLGTAILTDPSYGAIEGTVGFFWLMPLLYASPYAWALIIGSRWAQGRTAPVWAVAGLVVTAIGVYVLTSFKAALISPAVMLLVLRHYTVRPVKGRYLVIALVAFLLVLPMLYLHRAYGFNWERFRLVTWDEALAGFQILLRRSYLADSIAAVLFFTPRVYPFRYGMPWLDVLYFWVPRAVWPTKPLSFSREFGHTYFGSNFEAQSSFISPTLVGDAYLNFGTIGVGLVLLVIGYVLRRWYDGTVGRRPRPEWLLVYGASLYWIAISPEQSSGTATTLVVSYVAPAVLLALVARHLPRLLGRALTARR
jgi:hypothetical protein